MGTDKFKQQIKKNNELRTSTDEVTDALYEEAEKKTITQASVSEPSVPAVSPPVEPVPKVSKRSVGRPKGDDTVRKTIYIPDHMWPYIQAAVKLNGGNLQKYLNGLLEADIDKNRDKYRELADLFRSIDQTS